MRAPEARRHGRRRPSTIADPAAQAKAFEDAGLRMAACRRPQRRVRGPFGQWRGRRGDPEGDEEPGAARRRHPHAGRYRELAGQGPGARHPRHGRGARSRSGQARPASASRERSPSASTPRAARSPSRAGRRRRRSASSNWRGNSRAPASRPSSIPTSTATAFWPASTGQATIELADAVSIPVIASGGLASIADIVRMTMPDASKLEGAISGRALYDGRIDPAEALAICGCAQDEGRTMS